MAHRAVRLELAIAAVRAASLAIVLLALSSVSSVAAQDTRAHDLLVRLLEQSKAPAISAVVMQAGKIVFSEGIGSADLASGEPQTGKTVHNIGSVSKVVSTVAVMQLVERRKLALDAEIQRYAPWFPRKAQPISVRQILTHTSGIRHYRAGELKPGNSAIFRHYTKFEESTRFWRDDPLLFEPGTHWAYSSFAFNLLQAVIEKASGQPFERYLRDHVWAPAGMRVTQFDVAGRSVAHRGRAYVRNPSGQLEPAMDEDLSYKFAAGGMLSSDEDLARFGHALNRGVLLKPTTTAELYRLQLPAELPRFEPQASEPPVAQLQALGMHMGDAHGHPRAGHLGVVKGAITAFHNYYRDDLVVVVYTNLGSDNVDIEAAAEALAALFYPAATR